MNCLAYACLFRRQEKPWALRRQEKLANGSVREFPVSTECEECFRFRTEHFPHMTALVFGSSRRTLEGFQAKVDKARGVSTGSSKDFPDERLSEDIYFSLDLKRNYLVANESEIKRLAKQTRLAKTPLKSLPQLEVPSEDDPNTRETVYAFRDPSKPLREACITTRLSLCKAKVHMKDNAWEGKGDELYEHHLKNILEDRGVSSLILQEHLGGPRRIQLDLQEVPRAPGIQPLLE